MFDMRTRRLFLQILKHPLQGLWRVARMIDDDVDLEQRRLLLNLVMGLPSEDRQRFHRELAWIREHICEGGLSFLFPYEDRECHRRSVGDVISGEAYGCEYVIHEQKRLYFPQSWKELCGRTPAESYLDYIEDEGLLGGGCRECSPHCYTSANHHPERNDVLLDVGCAEALYALHWIDDVRKVYLFECEKMWEKPLRLTFARYGDDVSIVRKLVGDGRGGSVRLSDVIKESADASYFVKMDIEGAERFVIKSSADFLQTHKVKMSVCCYHRQDDAEVLGKMLSTLGFSIEYSDGYMLTPLNGMIYPYFRKGVIYARNY